MIYLDNLIFSLQRHGGVSVLWGEVIKELQKKDLDFCCLEYRGSDENKVRQTLNIPSTRIDYQKVWSITLESYNRPKISSNERTIYHTPLYHTCLGKNIIRIATIHDFIYNYYAKGLRRWLHNFPIYRTIRDSDYLICVSENTKQDLLKFLPEIKEEKIRVIYNGVSDCYRVCDNHRSDCQEYVVFVGGRQWYKNFRLAVESVANTRYKLLVVGGALSEEEKSLLNDKMGQSRWKSVVHPTNEELNSIYNSAFCLLYPSSYEGFGIPVIEAQKAGCPVIALNASSIPEIIGDSPLVFEHTTVEAVRGKLEILRNQSARKEIIEKGLLNSQRFSWKKMAKDYIQLYEALYMKCP